MESPDFTPQENKGAGRTQTPEDYYIGAKNRVRSVRKALGLPVQKEFSGGEADDFRNWLFQGMSDEWYAKHGEALSAQRANQDEDKPRSKTRKGQRGFAALDLVTAPAQILKALSSTEDGQKLLHYSGRMVNALKSIVAPAKINEASQRAADIHSKGLAELHLEEERAKAVLKFARKAIDRLSKSQQLALMDAAEGKTEGVTFGRNETERKAISDALAFMRKTLDEDHAAILVTGKALSYIENYFPHMYKDAAKARPILEAYAKRPMEGTKAWAKHRTIPYLSDAILEHGLEPASWNLIDMFQARHFDMQKFITAHKIVDAYKREKLVRYLRTVSTAPAGWEKLDDRIAELSGVRHAIADVPVENGEPVRSSVNLLPGAKMVYGHYWAPAEVARIFNNYLSPGFLKGPLAEPYKVARTANNLLNMAQLGLSAFHGTFITIEGAAGDVSRGMMQVFRDGKLGSGLLHMAKGAAVPWAVADTFKQGLAFRKALLAEDAPPEWSALRDMFIRGGGRVSMDSKEYGTPFARMFVEGWRKALTSPDVLRTIEQQGMFVPSTSKDFWERFKGGAAGALATPFATVELFAKPILEIYVPIMKMGTMAQLFRDEMARLPEDATQAEIDRMARKVVDHVEDRMGQMTYDNLHWNAFTRQVFGLGLRAVGWDVGSWRMLLGAGKDVLAAAPRAARALAAAAVHDEALKAEIKAEQERRDRLAGEFGKNKWMTYNMAQTFAVFAVVGLVSGLLTWLMTGKPPKEAKDLLYIKTGRQDKYGKDERLQLASYAKEGVDILHILEEMSPVHHENGKLELGFNLSPAFKYLWGKKSPLMGTVDKFATNQNWDGTQVFTPNAGKKTLEELGLAALKEFEPISAVQAAEKLGTIGGSKSLLPALGLTKPRQENLNTKAENKLVELLADRQPRVIEKDKGDREKMLRNAKDAYVLGNQKPLKDLMAEGQLTATDYKGIVKAYKSQSLITRLANANNITAQDLIKVWPDMSDQEKAGVYQVIARKTGTAFKSTPPSDRPALKENLAKIRGEALNIVKK
jgi:hypothetical protein